MGIWCCDKDDPKLKPLGRTIHDFGGQPFDTWACASTMWGVGGPRHALTSPYYDAAPQTDGRHSCYCQPCAIKNFADLPPLPILP